MRTQLSVLIIFAALATNFVAAQNAANGTSVDVIATQYVYASTVSSLNQVDFRNLRVFYDPGDASDRGVVLHDGAYKKPHKYGYEYVKLNSVELFKTKDKQFAIVSLIWMDCGGSCTNLGKIQVFTLRDGHPVVTQHFEYDRDATGVSDSFTSGNDRLIIVARSEDHSAHCCPAHLDIVRLDWDGSKFVLKTSKTIPSIESAVESLNVP